MSPRRTDTGYELTHFGSANSLAQHVAGMVLETIRAREHFSLALSGGRIAGAFFQALAAETLQRKADLGRVHFFWADERCVPPADSESNYQLARSHLLAPLGMAEGSEQLGGRVHRIRGELPPAEAAQSATADAQAALERGPSGLPQLDLVLLGMGEDGHVASLFPGATECQAPTDIYSAVRGPKPPLNRVTVSYGMLAEACQVWVLISGQGKEIALADSLKPGGLTPLGRVIELRKATHLFADF